MIRFYLNTVDQPRWRCQKHVPKRNPDWRQVSDACVNLNDCWIPKCESCGAAIQYGRSGYAWTPAELEAIARGEGPRTFAEVPAWSAARGLREPYRRTTD